jgi:hypothetical protein
MKSSFLSFGYALLAVWKDLTTIETVGLFVLVGVVAIRIRYNAEWFFVTGPGLLLATGTGTSLASWWGFSPASPATGLLDILGGFALVVVPAILAFLAWAVLVFYVSEAHVKPRVKKRRAALALAAKLRLATALYEAQQAASADRKTRI